MYLCGEILQVLRVDCEKSCEYAKKSALTYGLLGTFLTESPFLEEKK
jgi:hypothetical protein